MSLKWRKFLSWGGFSFASIFISGSTYFTSSVTSLNNLVIASELRSQASINNK